MPPDDRAGVPVGSLTGAAAYGLLQQQLITVRERLDRQVFQLHRLNDLSDRLLHRPATDPVAETFAEAVVDVFDIAAGAVWILGADSAQGDAQVAVLGLPGPADRWWPLGEALRDHLEAQSRAGAIPVTDIVRSQATPAPLVDAIASRCVGRDGGTVAVILAGNTATTAGVRGSFSDDAFETLTLLGQKLSSQLDRAADWRMIEAQVQRVRESEQRYRMLAENSSDIVLMADRDRIVQWVSPSITAVLGWSPDDVIGRRTSELVHPDQHAALAPDWERVDAGEVVTGRVLALCRDGTTRWLARTLRPVRDDTGALIGHVGGFRDVQNEVIAEQDLLRTSERASEARRLLKVALDNSPISFAVYRIRRDAAGEVEGFTVEFVNETVTRARGRTVQLVGADIRDAFPEARDLGIEAEMREAVGSEVPRRMSLRVPDARGGIQALEIAIARVDADLVVTSAIDVTDLYRAQAEAAAARDVAESASRAKSDFLATVTHELRTPLTTMIGTTELLLDEGLTPGQRDLVAQQRDAARMLLALVNDILDLSRIEAGRIELEWLDLDLRALVEGTLRMFDAAASTRGLTLTSSVDRAIPAHVLGDPVRLQQVLLNLVSNAVKFTVSGGIDVQVTARAVGPDGVEAAFRVSDTGIGIPAGAVERVFDSFSQASTSTTRLFGGSGLGLSIARRLVDLMGGRIEIESEEGRGTTVAFTAMLRPAALAEEAVPEPVAVPSDRPGPRVLLAEDNDVNRMLLTRMLQKIGCAVTTAVSGVEAVEAVEHGEFDLVLMDLAMPEMDGFAATRRIRQLQESKPSPATPILALTANATSDIAAEASEAGMDGFLGKPISLRELTQAVDAWARSPGQMEKSSISQTPPEDR